MHHDEHPPGITVRAMHLGEPRFAATGEVILADAGDVLVHVGGPAGCLSMLLTPEEALGVAGALIHEARIARRRRKADGLTPAERA